MRPRPDRLRVLAALALAACGAGAHGAEPVDAIDMRIPHPPHAVTIEGRCRLAYELHLTNFGAESRTLSALDVSTDGAAFAHLDRAALRAAGRVLGRDAADDALRLPAGTTAVLYLEPDCGARVPEHVQHALQLDGAGSSVVGARSEVVPQAAASLGPPLRGGPWVAVHAAHWPRGHRRVFYAIDGRARLPGRFAVDWVRVDDDGRIARGDGDRVDASLGYGAAVLAVADARVAAVRDGLPEPGRISAARKNSLDAAAGNHIALQLPDGRFVLYEHLRPHSVRVRIGDRVRRGQHIADLGFTGDSTGPHLHLHVADSASPLLGEGVPFALDGFELLGHYDDAAGIGKTRWQARAATLAAMRRDEFPASNAVIRFATDPPSEGADTAGAPRRSVDAEPRPDTDE
ncbi:M23 family metallopeptidase [Chiayiivirga flava]|uniref:Murein DD-endopeptidase MepM/ murein hydrolase activator NlpD n=1 Tax=Chiayiivirga flava TaxID=659595 RepID=A0A7W8G261_9GAMM|nr:M23 family metallopeptidase [Chiayiivirga flava]MBB5208355.1 murein DD-endopeptidase MepM/ murein hydrolase activator NlpD [Chiayiivirga flava]